MAEGSIALVVLAGGKSSRFGGNKALHLIDGRPIAQMILDELGPLASNKILSIAPGQSQEFKKIVEQDVKIIEDEQPFEGPLSGVASALDIISEDFTLLCPCDTPNVTSKLYQLFLNRIGRLDAAMPLLNGYYEPITAAYRTLALRKAVSVVLEEGAKKVSRILDYLDVVGIDEKGLKTAGLDVCQLVNLNEPPR